jgi:hypothetical protein
MRYFLDTEFIEDGKTIDLISIGIISEDGRNLYLIHRDFDILKAWKNDWVKNNVLKVIHEDYCKNSVLKFINGGMTPKFNYLGFRSVVKEVGKNRKYIASAIRGFCDPEKYGKPEFWGYYADYDWVVFAQIFGTMMDLPNGFPMYCRDLNQWCDDLGNPRLPEQTNEEHNALEDAKWNKEVYDFLLNYKTQ